MVEIEEAVFQLTHPIKHVKILRPSLPSEDAYVIIEYRDTKTPLCF